MKKRTKRFFDEFARDYDQEAFRYSIGTQYLSSVETTLLQEAIEHGKDKTVLDVGVGTGRLSQIVAREKYVNLIGIDISRKMISQTNRKVRQTHLVLADAEATPFQSNIFNLVIAMRVLKYTPSWKKTIKEMSRISQCRGLFIFSIANRHSIQVLTRNRSYFLLSLGSVEGVLKEKGFTILKIITRKRLPFRFYKAINMPLVLSFFIFLEKLLDKIFPEALLATDILILAKKVSR
jgi:ubiquinone/menaquinone biosynthesis C-methylase UbiE